MSIYVCVNISYSYFTHIQFKLLLFLYYLFNYSQKYVFIIKSKFFNNLRSNFIFSTGITRVMTQLSQRCV